MRLQETIIRIIDRFYRRPFTWLVPRQTFRYAACGGGTTVLGWVCYFLIYNFVVEKRFFDLGFVRMSPHVAALVLVFPITFFVGFWLNRNVAFRWSPLRETTQLVRYALSVAGSILLNYACLKLLVEMFGIWPTPSQVIASCVVMVYSYLAAKYFTFRHAARE